MEIIGVHHQVPYVQTNQHQPRGPIDLPIDIQNFELLKLGQDPAHMFPCLHDVPAYICIYVFLDSRYLHMRAIARIFLFMRRKPM